MLRVAARSTPADVQKEKASAILNPKVSSGDTVCRRATDLLSFTLRKNEMIISSVRERVNVMLTVTRLTQWNSVEWLNPMRQLLRK